MKATFLTAMLAASTATACDECTEQCTVDLPKMEQLYMWFAIQSVVSATKSADTLTSALSTLTEQGAASDLFNSWATAQNAAASMITGSMGKFQQVFQIEVDQWVDQLREVLSVVTQRQQVAGSKENLAEQVASVYSGQADVFNYMSKVATSCQDCLYWSRSIIPNAEAERSALTSFLSEVDYQNSLGPWANYIECTTTTSGSVTTSSA